MAELRSSAHGVSPIDRTSSTSDIATAAGVERPDFTVVIPTFNRARTLPDAIHSVLAQSYRSFELVVVDDCSTDGTRDLLAGLQAELGFELLLQARNMGKGAALRRGFEAVRGDLVVVQDADLEYSPEEFPDLIDLICQGRADVVYGSRFLGGGAHRVLYFWHSVGNKVLTTLSNMFTDLNLTDMETCYKVFRREVLESFTLEEDRFGIEPEITAKVAAGRWRVYEVSISYNGRTYEEGKKIGWRDGVAAVFHIIRFNMFPPPRR